MRRLDPNFGDSWKISNLLEDSLVSVKKKEASQKGYGFFRETRREVGIDFQD
jgi:hypothetical protein